MLVWRASSVLSLRYIHGMLTTCPVLADCCLLAVMLIATSLVVLACPQTVYGNINVSLHHGRVYFYDVCTELLRVMAVEKARARNENHGLFFQSRTAIAKLNAMDDVLFRKLKNKWYLRLDYKCVHTHTAHIKRTRSIHVDAHTHTMHTHTKRTLSTH